MNVIREMEALDGLIDIDASKDQVNSPHLLSNQKSLKDSDLLRTLNENSMLRASLILLTIVMIIFTIMKICKLAHQIQQRYRQQEASKSNDEIPGILIQEGSTGRLFRISKRRKQQNQKLARTSRIWKAKSKLGSALSPSKGTKVDIPSSKSRKWKQDKSKMPQSSSKSTRTDESKNIAQSQDISKTKAFSGERNVRVGKTYPVRSGSQ
uniref:Uncharacterized protein n=1 Tax=Setaria digitata TaxID=48799 RepID=A0A915Q1U1_9BILA